MIKLMQCVRKSPELSTVEFRRRWQEYGARLRELAAELDAVRVVVDTTLESAINQRLGEERASLPPFDGVAQIWWERGAGLIESLDSEAMQQRLAHFRQFQESFVAIESSSLFFVIEDVTYEIDGRG